MMIQVGAFSFLVFLGLRGHTMSYFIALVDYACLGLFMLFDDALEFTK